MTVHVLRLRPGKEKPVLAGHPWIFSGALAELDSTLPAGALVTFVPRTGAFWAAATSIRAARSGCGC